MKCAAVVSLLCTVALIGGLPMEIEQENPGAVVKETPMREINKINGRVFNGSPASKGQFPWQVALYFKASNGSTSFCGGSLISANWVLTATHCVAGSSSFSVVLGTIDLTSGGGTEIGVSNVILHSNNSNSNRPPPDDIALLKLSSAAPLSDTIKPIDLADSTLGAGVKVTVSGWGKTSDSGSRSDTLNYADLRTISYGECQANYPNVDDSSNVCVVGGALYESACNGDSGGPLVIVSDSSAIQVGVVSYGKKESCELGYPTVYTRVAAFRSWIKNKTGI